MLESRKGDCMQTYTGGEFYPLDPRPEEIRLVDIASALSKQCRFGGHCLKFYSVAEHCVHVAAHASDQMKLSALMHDASEAYLCDIPRPIKPHLQSYAEMENRLMLAIADRFGFTWPMPPEVKQLDNAILADEMSQNMAESSRDWGLTEPPLGVRLRYWAPTEAAYEFTSAFHRYQGRGW